MLRFTAFAIVVGLSVAPRTGSAAVREECMADAIKFCGAVIHDDTKRRACVWAHSLQLSGRCRQALNISYNYIAGLYSEASDQVAIKTCKATYGGRRGMLQIDKPDFIEWCYKQRTGKYPWQ